MSNTNSASSSRPVDIKKIRESVEYQIKTFRQMPALVTDILDIVNSPAADNSKIAEGMKYDPGLTTNVLRLANSAYFGMPRSVSSVNEAIVRLGTKRVCDLIIASGIGKELRVALPGYDLEPEQLLQHCVWVAVASEEFCIKLKQPTPDLLFTAGLLHDVGKLVIAEHVGEHIETIREHLDAGLSFEKAEDKTLGINHAEAGAAILKRWNFPAPLISAVRWHHKPDKAGSEQNIADIVHLADCLAYAQGAGAGLDAMKYIISRETEERMSATTEDVQYVASVTLDKMMELQDILRS